MSASSLLALTTWSTTPRTPATAAIMPPPMPAIASSVPEIELLMPSVEAAALSMAAEKRSANSR
jgi:hypothetical protein